MTLTKSQKIYGAVMLVAATAFVWDRATSGPAAVEAAGTPTAADMAIAPESIAVMHTADVTVEQDGLRQRLGALAAQRCLDASAPENAFELSPDWAPPKKVELLPVAPVAPAENEANKKLAEAFSAHHLDAVMVGQRGYANVDGQGIFIGESFDKFTLLSVTKTSAVFGLENVRVELRLTLDGRISRKGVMIDNVSPRRGDGLPKK